MYSPVPTISSLLRALALILLEDDIELEIRYIPTRENAIADALSRMQFPRFHQVAPGAESSPTDLSGLAPALLLPIRKLLQPK
jgi:hypothetical protein